MSLLTLLFGACSHRDYTFPQTKKTGPDKGTHVTCTECGAEFWYDWRAMQVLEEIRSAPEHREAVPETYRVGE